VQHIYRTRGKRERSSTRSPQGRHHSAPGLSGGQEVQLRELFALHGMEQGYLETIAGKLEGGLPTSRVGRHLKAMGLRRGILTAEQVFLWFPLFPGGGNEMKKGAGRIDICLFDIAGGRAAHLPYVLPPQGQLSAAKRPHSRAKANPCHGLVDGGRGLLYPREL